MRTTRAAGAQAEREGRLGEVAGGTLSAVASWPKRTKEFLADVRGEMKRVTWPGTKQIRATTVVVIVTVFLFGAYFAVLDWLYTRLVEWLLRLGG